jgi:futalosine hydrolase
MSRKKTPIALLSAVPFEAKKILASLSDTNHPAQGITTGNLDSLNLVHVSSGPGTANAASAATLLIERYSPSALVVFGIGGAFHNSGLSVGDVAAAESETFAELGAITPEGFRRAEEIGLSTLTRGSRKYYETFRMDPKLLRLSAAHVSSTGPFLTVSTVTGSLKEARKIIQRHAGALCENMEGAAVALVCARYGLPMLEVRGISNMVEDRDVRKWKKDDAARNCQAALVEVLKLLQ